MRLMVKKQFKIWIILLLMLCGSNSFLIGIYGQSNHQTKATLLSDGGSYTLSHILGHYNVFTSEDYYGTHVVGPMIVGGRTGRTTLDGGQGSLSIGGISHTSGTVKEFKHDVPSYFKKKTMIAGNTVITSSDVPLYLGSENQNVTSWALQGPNNQVYDDYYFTDGYVDFNEAVKQLKQDALSYQSYSGPDHQGKMINKVDLSLKLVNQVKSELAKNKDYVYENEYCKIFRNEQNRLEKDGLTIQLKLGHNYHFECLNDFDCIIYDYDRYDDETTTIISCDDQTITSFPKILKTQKDVMGNVAGGVCLNQKQYQTAYQFDTLESGYHTSIMYLCLNASMIKIPGGQGKLNGHLVALDALVNIYSGDYNGTIVAKSVNSKAEGHMWCYHGMTTPGILDLNLKKLVNSKTPDQQFTFELSCLKGPTDSTIYQSLLKETLKTNNQSNGVIHYRLNGFNQVGEYIFKVRELDSKGYKCTPEAIYIKVKATLNHQTIVPTIEGYYQDEAGSQKLDQPHFNNVNTTSLKVQKRWLDENGQDMQAPVQQINLDLYQQAYLKKGYDVKVKVLLKQNNTLTTVKEENVFVKEKGKLCFQVDSRARYQNLYITGIEKIKCNQGTVVEKRSDHHQWNTHYDARKNLEIKDIQGNDEVEIIYSVSPGIQSSINPQDIHLTIQSYDQGEYQKAGPAALIKTIQLDANHHWFQEINDLITNKDNQIYRYYVQEKDLSGFKTTYQINDKNSSLAGEIETAGNETIQVINKKEKSAYLLIKKIGHANKNQGLKDAGFTLYDEKKQPQKFKLNQGTYFYDKQGDPLLITDQKGCIKIDLNSLKSLNIKNYTLKEVKLPEGYKGLFEEVKLHFDENHDDCYYKIDNQKNQVFKNHDIHTMTLENEKVTIQVPDTGYGGLDFKKAGICLLIGAMSMEMIKQVKRRKKTKC